jgi:hypothetical protein
MDRNELYEVELHMRKMADATAESTDADERLESPSWRVARDAVNLAGALTIADGMQYLRDELERLETDEYIARKVISECERRLYWREQRLAEAEESERVMEEQRRKVAAAETPEHVIDPETMDAIRKEAKSGEPPLSDARGLPVGMAAVARVADAARAAVAAASAPATSTPATARAAVPAPTAEPAAAPAGGQRPARGRA